MGHTKAFYEERREKIAARKKEFKDNREEERAAYTKVFYEAGYTGTLSPNPSPTERGRKGELVSQKLGRKWV